jgi:uncharacterized protein with LGFP repeats
MFLSIDADTSLSWDIEYITNAGRKTALLRMKDGAWYLTREPQAGESWVAGVRVEWPEALKRALIVLTATS